MGLSSLDVGMKVGFQSLEKSPFLFCNVDKAVGSTKLPEPTGPNVSYFTDFPCCLGNRCIFTTWLVNEDVPTDDTGL